MTCASSRLDQGESNVWSVRVGLLLDQVGSCVSDLCQLAAEVLEYLFLCVPVSEMMTLTMWCCFWKLLVQCVQHRVLLCFHRVVWVEGTIKDHLVTWWVPL